MFSNLTARRRTLINTTLLACACVLAGCSEIYSRDDLATLVKDKSREQVVKELGKPAQVDEGDAKAVRYVYLSRTFNIEAGNKRDEKTVLVFSPAADGTLKVASVLYE